MGCGSEDHPLQVYFRIELKCKTARLFSCYDFRIKLKCRQEVLTFDHGINTHSGIGGRGGYKALVDLGEIR